MTYLLLSIAGLIGGFIAGLTGIGTGFLMVVVIPVALRYMNMPDDEIVRFTIANTIFATLCSSFVNNISMWRKKQLYVLETGIVSAVAVVSSSIVLQWFVLKEEYSSTSYNIIIIIFLAYIIYRTINKLRQAIHYEEDESRAKLATTGLIGGVVSAITGLGGGSIIIPMLNLWMRMDIKKAKSISFGAIFAISLMLTILNLVNTPATDVPYQHAGYILMPVALPLAAGVIIASPLGTGVSDKLSSKTITIVFLVVISLVLLRKVLEVWG